MKKVILLLALTVVLTACTKNASENLVTQQTDQERFTPNPAENSTVQTASSSEDLNINQDNQMSTQTQSGEIKTEGDLVLIKTSLGDIKAKLNEKEAPISTENFKKYISKKFYDGTIFHRVMPGFMIQGGGFDVKGVEKQTLTPIKNEAKNGLSNKRGTLAMARTMVTDSATSQFFINLTDNDFLNYRDDTNYGYAVFGEVIEGMDVVDKIAQVQTTTKGMYENWPIDNVVLKSIEMVK